MHWRRHSEGKGIEERVSKGMERVSVCVCVLGSVVGDALFEKYKNKIQ